MKLLVFDLGHVLIDFEWMKVCYAFSERLSKPTHEILRAFDYVGGLGYERGHITTRDFVDKFNEQLAANLSLSEFESLWSTSFRENSSMADLLKSLKVNYRLCLLSNTNVSHYEFIQNSFDVERHFDETVLSYRVGFVKPQEEIYREVVRKCGVEFKDCLFVDDLEPNVKAARTLGMKAIQFTEVEGLKSELTGFGIKI